MLFMLFPSLFALKRCALGNRDWAKQDQGTVFTCDAARHYVEACMLSIYKVVQA